jgi:UTP-glucose-1-phosphate uridylyltransferase
MMKPDSIILYYQKHGNIISRDFSNLGLGNAIRIARSMPNTQPWLVLLGDGSIAMRSSNSEELETQIQNIESL